MSQEAVKGLDFDLTPLLLDGIGAEYLFAAMASAVAMRGDPEELQVVESMLRSLSIKLPQE
jgi:hypothetical protein